MRFNHLFTLFVPLFGIAHAIAMNNITAEIKQFTDDPVGYFKANQKKGMNG